jgi:hypothetical protein
VAGLPPSITGKNIYTINIHTINVIFLFENSSQEKKLFDDLMQNLRKIGVTEETLSNLEENRQKFSIDDINKITDKTVRQLNDFTQKQNLKDEIEPLIKKMDSTQDQLQQILTFLKQQPQQQQQQQSTSSKTETSQTPNHENSEK